MDRSNEQSADGQNNNPDINSLISAQNLKFDYLTEVLRNRLNAFGQNLGRHLGELVNNKPNKKHLTCCTFAQEVGSGKLSYLCLQSDCVGSVRDV